MAERDVRSDSVGEQKTFLIHDADLAAECVQIQVAQILSVRKNAAVARIVKARDQTQQRAFARAGHAENADDLAGFGGRTKSCCKHGVFRLRNRTKRFQKRFVR